MEVQAYLNESKVTFNRENDNWKILKINYTRKVPTCFETSSASEYFF